MQRQCSAQQHWAALLLSRMPLVFLDQNWASSVFFPAVTEDPVNERFQELFPTLCLLTWPPLMSIHDWMWQGHTRSSGSPSSLCSQFCCSGSQLLFSAGWHRDRSLASSWVMMPHGLPGGWACQTLTHCTVGQTNQLPQTAVTSLPSNLRSGKYRRVLKRIIWVIPVGIFFFPPWRNEGVQSVQFGCPLWLPVALHSALRRSCFLDCWRPATKAARYLCSRGTLCNPSWELIMHHICWRRTQPERPAHEWSHPRHPPAVKTLNMKVLGSDEEQEGHLNFSGRQEKGAIREAINVKLKL